MLHCCHVILCQEILNQNRPVCWSIVKRKKPTVGSTFFGVFHSDRIPNGENDAKFYLLSHSQFCLQGQCPVSTKRL